MTLSIALLLGLGMGIKHALEADHLAAVCTMVTAGGSVARAARIGALWGLGHALCIVGLGSLLVMTGLRVPEHLAMLLDAAVALMLIALGIAGLRAVQRGLESGDALHSSRVAPNLKKPLAVGAVHGASGTAALTLLVASTIPGRSQGLAFIFLFGAASILGMALVAAAVALPLQSARRRSPHLFRAVQGFAGAASIAAGFSIAWSLTHDLLRA